MKTQKRYLTILLLALTALMITTPPVSAAVSGSVQVAPNITDTATTDFGTATWSYGTSTGWTNTFTSGSGLNQASKVFIKTTTLAGSGAYSLDLDATNTGPLGETVTFSRIYMILARRTDTPAASTQDENVNVGGDWVLTKYLTPGADTLSAVTIPMRPGGLWYVLAPDSTGIPVTATTGDQITWTNASSADSCTLSIIVLGS
jgi:hypothetical protein